MKYSGYKDKHFREIVEGDIVVSTDGNIKGLVFVNDMDEWKVKCLYPNVGEIIDLIDMNKGIVQEWVKT